MNHSYLENCNIISPLGWDTRENLQALLSGKEGIQSYNKGSLSRVDLPLALLDWTVLEKRFLNLVGPDEKKQFSRFEKLGILSINDALRTSRVDPGDPETAFILSTTKGNVELLDGSSDYDSDRLYLWKSAEVIAAFFAIKSKPVIVSNACISGVSAMLVGQQMIGRGKYKHAIVLGADLVSRFIVSGFQSFLSLSAQPCRPFDSKRDGLTLGEAAATLIISSNPDEVELVGGSTSNDANHISGPSRSGEGLLLAIRSTLKGRAIPGVISAHGTATLYNDEMESIALSRAGLGGVAVNSLKGYFGHTLGAAGLVESIINIECLKQGKLPTTKGFSTLGVSGDINVSDSFGQGEKESFLKIASGFGGCNAAALFILR